MAQRKKTAKPYMEPSTHLMHFDGKRLQSWKIITTEIRTDPKTGKDYEVQVEKRRSDGHLIVMRTDRTGQRTIIEQDGYDIPSHLPGLLDANVKWRKRKEAA